MSKAVKIILILVLALLGGFIGLFIKAVLDER